jgi:hypothetical protein
MIMQILRTDSDYDRLVHDSGAKQKLVLSDHAPASDLFKGKIVIDAMNPYSENFALPFKV